MLLARTLLLTTALLIAALPAPSLAEVVFVRTPNEGIQPQAAIDQSGVLHLVYFKGDPKAGDLFYVRRASGEGNWTEPLPVNHQPGAAIAIGTIRGAQLSLGQGNRVHVVWNGSERSVPSAQHAGAPLLYTRLNESGSGFEPERDLITYAAGLDGGSSVAADGQGRVYVTWHARTPDGPDGEEGRAVFVARSDNNGRVFAAERRVTTQETGVCACCGMRAFAGPAGELYLLFRSAVALTNRNQILLASQDHAEHFQQVLSHPWISATCPMSSATLIQGKGSVLAAWETAGQVYSARVGPQVGDVSKLTAPPGRGDRKHPVAVQNGNGEILMVWAEGTGWERGGTLAWQVFDAHGQPLPEHGSKSGVPVWSLPTAVAQADGRFVVIY